MLDILTDYEIILFDFFAAASVIDFDINFLTSTLLWRMRNVKTKNV